MTYLFKALLLMCMTIITQAERPGFKFWLSFFFSSFSHKPPFGLYSACVKSHETEPPVARMVSNFQKFSSLKVYGKDSMICRRSMKLETKTPVAVDPHEKMLNGTGPSARLTRSIYERAFMAEPIDKLSILCYPK